MKYDVNPANYHDLFLGTSLRGELDAPYHEVVDTIGEPLADDFDKADATWLIAFEDGTVATLYNYKDGVKTLGDQGTPTEQLHNWHIGGKSQRAVELVQWLFGREAGTGEQTKGTG